MKKFLLLALAGVALLPVPALAADMGAPVYKAPPLAPPPPAPTWTGCYVNGGAGYGMWNQDHYTEDASTLDQISVSYTNGGRGWLGLVGGGCDYQFSTGTWGNWVVGVLGDYDFMNLKGTNEFAPPAADFFGNETETGAWAIGARIGWLVTPNLLTYWDGGYTQARFGAVNFNTEFNPSFPTDLVMQAHTYNGWFLGGGVEYALPWLPGLFWRNEYRYSSYNSANVPIIDGATGVPTPFAEHSQKFVQTATTSLVWRFNWWGH
jgi:outer membrane immunogenic protein